MANTVDYLLSVYDSIRISCEYADSSIVKYMFLKDGKPVYSVGQRVRVKCVKTDVSGGNIDFVMVTE